MASLGIAAIWAGVVVYLLVRGERGFRDWLALKTPLNEEQAAKLTARIDDLQNQISRLSIDKDFD